ncbi:SafA/ExsA family spore coat assembly protein [Bacillus solitudinis]|uniref:SafA/ExsA family spore coat assembly protein n=1 Tax=Bacillus solitudinis TaxID=2014074 RepID=UPI000C243D56|nr:SafA/ExsA family spore coat assembly protein [Bacillus solitudinis]
MLCKSLIVVLFLFVTIPTMAQAQSVTHTVVSGDSMWKIAVRYEVGLSEIIAANPHISNPNLIYPNQKLTIPLSNNVKSLEQQVLNLTNKERANYGLKPLRANWELARVARYKSADMRDKRYFSHTSPTYGSPFDMMRNFGVRYSSAAENIAMGQQTPEQVVKDWMNSEGHRKNILSQNVTELGVGYAQGGSGRHYWTQLFRRP